MRPSSHANLMPGLYAAIAACGLAAACSTPDSQRTPGSGFRLAKHDRARLEWLRAQGRKTATILIAYPPGSGADLRQRLAELGGNVRYQAETLGYLRVDIPTERIMDASALSGIDALNINGTQVYGAAASAFKAQRVVASYHGAAGADSVRWRVEPPNASTPPENPYLPTRDVGAPQFVAAHPTFDGRGVTIGMIECCPDFWHPVFRDPAFTREGAPTRKLAGLYTVVAADSETTNRIHLGDWVKAVDGRFTYDRISYRAPRDGLFRVGYYYGRTSFYAKAYEDPQRDTLNRRSSVVAIFDPRSGDLWLDMRRDHDLRRVPPVRDYNSIGDVSAFGYDDPRTPWDDRLTFAVGIDTAQAIVDVYPGGNPHATMVGGVAAGGHFFGSRATGAAPGARLVFVAAGGDWRALGSRESNDIEGLILLARRHDVDIITTQSWFDLRLKDGTSVWSIVADRIVTTYHKMLFQSAGNEGRGLGTVGEAVNGAHVMKVGGSINRDTWYTNLALLADRQDYLFFSSRGPHADGGTSPDFVAPMVPLGAVPMGMSRDSSIRLNTGFFTSRPIYRNPPGYTLQFGTSFSAPTAAGVAALLLSAARQRQLEVDPGRVHWALSGGARYFPEYGAYEQGAGILNASAAWELLQHEPTPVEIKVDAPVRTVMSPYLRTPGRGRGLYEREGWIAGDSGTRLVTFTRISGATSSITYRLRWVGNDGTFVSEPMVELRRDAPVTVPVTVHPRTWGAHSALLQLINDGGATPEQQMSAVVVAAHPLDAAHHYVFAERGQAAWLGETSYFVSVPPGAASLDVSLAIERGVVRLTVMDPSGGRYPSMVPVNRGRHFGYPEDIPMGYTQQFAQGIIRRTIEFPEPGVWEIVVEHEGSAIPELRLKAQSAATFTFTACATRMSGHAVEPNDLKRTPSSVQKVRLTLHSDLGSVEGRLTGGPLASVETHSLMFRRGDPPITRDVRIEPGTERLAVAISRPSDSLADIDLHVFDCSSGECYRYVSAVFHGSAKELRVRKPRPGLWRMEMDPYDVPSGSTTVEYREEIVHRKYGMATVLHPLVRLAAGQTSTVTALVRSGVALEPGHARELRLELESSDNQAPAGPMTWGTRYPRGVLGVVRAELSSR